MASTLLKELLKNFFAVFVVLISVLLLVQKVPLTRAEQTINEDESMIISDSNLIATVESIVKEVSVSQLEKVLTDDIILIDVREPQETAQGIIPGAIKIPLGSLQMKLADIPTVRSSVSPFDELAAKDIYLYCRSGRRSSMAAESLQRMGLSNVYSLQGGFNAWRNTGLSIEE